jgi:hypothetical protein
MKDMSIRDGKVVLLRNFWGHKAETKGTITKGRLQLKGSPRATVFSNDVDNLFTYLTKEAQR